MTLRNILNRVHKLKPYRQFSSSTINYTKKNLYKPSLPILSIPWLMLPPDVKDGPNGPTDNYLNIIDKSIVKIDRPTAHGSVPFNTKCVGSAKGWVAFDCDSDGSLFLANPYASEASSRKLPGLSSGIFREGLHFTLVGDIPSNNFSLIMEGREWDRQVLQIINSNGLQPKEYGPRNSIFRVAYNRKANIVYELYLEESGKLQITMWYPLGDYKYAEIRQGFSLVLDPEVIGKYEELITCYPPDHSVEKYLAVTEENNPSLYFVIRHLAKEDGVGLLTKDIDLYKIDLEDDGKVECVDSIGDQVLFLGRNSEPFFISTRNCSGLKLNCVYLADELGYYDLVTKCITPFLSLGDLGNMRPHVYWIAPPLRHPDYSILPSNKLVHLLKRK